jgi:hypothetical protein
MDRAQRAKKYGGEECCVCGKYGAHRPIGEPLRSLILFAQASRLSLKRPTSEAVHDKCLRVLKALTNHKRSERENSA